MLRRGKLAGFGCLMLALAGCSGGGGVGAGSSSTAATSASRAPTASGGGDPAGTLPDATVTWLPDGTTVQDPRDAPSLVDRYAPACVGHPIPGSAPYSGTSHPLVIVGPVEGSDFSPPLLGESLWETGLTRAPAQLHPTRTGQVQLVACVQRTEVPAGTCGVVQRMDGVSGELKRAAEVAVVRVVAASTTQEISRRTYREAPFACGQLGVMVSGDPPWTRRGPHVDSVTAMPFLVQVATGPAR
jgi:hypothetical protein